MVYWQHLISKIVFCCVISVNHVYADGPVGDHVNNLQAHLDEYAGEIVWLLDQVEGILKRYEDTGFDSAQPETILDHWEAVKFHSAIESNYIPLYASIWQSLFAVKTAIEIKEPVPVVRNELETLKEVLWQSLGAIKLAAQYQDQGLLEETETREALTPSTTLIEIKQRLDRVLAKFAEKQFDEALEIVQETYRDRFESIEGIMFEKDAELIKDLEIDFNIHLPEAIKNRIAVEELRTVIQFMQAKLDQARKYLKEVERLPTKT